MSIKNGKVNALNVLNIRRVNFPAYHFVYTTIPKFNHNLVSKLNFWISLNLNGRYYIGQDIGLSSDNSIMYVTKIGFENEKELSFFSLACPEIK